MILSSPLLSASFFFFSCSGPLRDLPSFPTRRSSDLPDRRRELRLRLVPRARGLGTAGVWVSRGDRADDGGQDRKSTRLNSSHVSISYAVFCLKKKKKRRHPLGSDWQLWKSLECASTT